MLGHYQRPSASFMGWLHPNHLLGTVPDPCQRQSCARGGLGGSESAGVGTTQGMVVAR